ncbi:MAG TPA: flagellar assembly protein A [Gallionella sp.]|nr:flagellar assembly protein A [Gallionella sp.]
MVPTDLPDSLSNNIPQEDWVLPGFVSIRQEGIIIDLPRLHATGGFELFVDRLFTGGMRFFGLDYAAFLKLLYDADWLAAMQGKSAEVKIATKIARFLPQRQALYRAVKLLEGGNRAEYVFEPVSIEETYEEPVYGKPGEDGVPPVTGQVSKTRQVPAKLDFDEFVADMWLKGVKFGIDADAVRQAIASGAFARVTIARHLEPTEGRDAEILEVYPDLRRDNSPKILRDGKADLKAFKNRFPQVAKGKRLLKKVPRVLGKPGYKVAGEVIEPKIPEDVDLYTLALAGTSVEQAADGEYIVSALDGFIILDEQSNNISVTEKIETTGGVSAKMTGDLELSADEFIEHGEVEGGCTVKGKHMTFLSDVFGNVISRGGNISIAGNVAGGRIESQGGNVTLGKGVSRAMVCARDGEVTIHYCELSTIIGKIVRIERAVNCEIIADEVFTDVVEGCMIAAEKIKIASAGECRGRETLVTVLIPDLSGFDQRIATLQKKIVEAQESSKAKVQEIESLKSDQEFAKYLALHERIKSGAIKLTTEQAGNWRKLVEKNAKVANQMAKLNANTITLDLSVKESEEEIASAARERDAMGGDISCVIDKITGQTTGQTMKSANGADIFSGMPGSDIRIILQKVDSHKVRIFSEDSGSVGWKFKE